MTTARHFDAIENVFIQSKRNCDLQIFLFIEDELKGWLGGEQVAFKKNTVIWKGVKFDVLYQMSC